MRVVGYGRSLRVENRVPGGDFNAYLAMAAMSGAGLHGVDEKLPLEPAFEAAVTDWEHVRGFERL
jgi:glutamine synthetase